MSRAGRTNYLEGSFPSSFFLNFMNKTMPSWICLRRNPFKSVHFAFLPVAKPNARQINQKYGYMSATCIILMQACHNGWATSSGTGFQLVKGKSCFRQPCGTNGPKPSAGAKSAIFLTGTSIWHRPSCSTNGLCIMECLLWVLPNYPPSPARDSASPRSR